MSLATAAFRRLLRARAFTFAGDTAALQGASAAIRDAFDQNRRETDSEKISQMLRDAAEAEDMLKNHVAQGRLNEAGNYAVKLHGGVKDVSHPDDFGIGDEEEQRRR